VEDGNGKGNLDLGSLDTIELWEFLDVVDKDGVPLILKYDQWDSMSPLLQLRILYLDDIELLFLNQVSNVCDYVVGVSCFFSSLTVYN
jgi:hypothetical protein